jgi:uncharacterized protein YqeY
MSTAPIPAQPGPDGALRQRLRTALRAAMKAGDRRTVSALRSTLAAIDNAEAVEVAGPAGSGQAIEQSPVGAGAADVARRTLTEAEVEQIVHAEAEARDAAARDYDTAGKTERAEQLRAEAGMLLAHLADHPGSDQAPKADLCARASAHVEIDGRPASPRAVSRSGGGEPGWHRAESQVRWVCCCRPFVSARGAGDVSGGKRWRPW